MRPSPLVRRLQPSGETVHGPRLFAVAAGNAVLFVAFSAVVALHPATVPVSSGGGVDPQRLKPAKFAGSIAAFAATLW